MAPVAKENGADVTEPGTQSTDPDPQAMVIESLRSQIQDLFSQVTQLNNKLVKSYERVSTLEDDLHLASSTIRSSSLKISQLELERSQHLSALNAGLLVEKSQVTAELTRLMEKATEEAMQRGQAESARADIEKDLDDLSANLFSQANTMVAEARWARAQSERKVEDAEAALKTAEDAVATMQREMQILQEEKDKSDLQAENMRALMGKGKWTEKSSQEGVAPPAHRLRSSHPPYQEFLVFVNQLRLQHHVTPTPPAISTLLSMSFLVRLVAEDSEPTLRLDLAPSLNWLSRRSVLSAILSGQLIIEPMSLSTLMRELSTPSPPSFSNPSPMVPGITSQNSTISCALCGTLICSLSDDQSSRNTHSRSPTYPLTLSRSWSKGSYNSANPWSPSALFKSSLPSISSNPQSQLSPFGNATSPQQIHIFRLAVTPSPAQIVSATTSFPLISSSVSPSSPSPPSSSKQSINNSAPTRNPSTIYPLCTNGWCLTRLRATCTLWAFIRTGLVDKVWEEEILTFPSSPQSKPNGKVEVGADSSTKPPVPPRRGGWWGVASALKERATSWGEGEKDLAREKVLPKPPPSHPATKAAAASDTPPPLPKRSEGRRVPPPYNPTPDVLEQVPQTIDKKAEEVSTKEPRKSDENTPLPTLNVSTTELAAPASHTESDDAAFLTPTEELNPVFDTTQTSTPAPTPEAPRADTVDTTDINSPPARPSPASAQPESPPQTSASLPQKDEGGNPANMSLTPSRTVSPVPPPLPRRAAARGGRSPPKSQSALQDKGTGGVEAASAVVPSASSEAPEAQPVSESLSVGEPAPEEGKPESVVPETATYGGDPPVPSEPSQSLSEPETVTANGVPTVSIIESDVSADDPSGKVVSEDVEVYIGDATWVERSWKELVKLREEMFWARIGGVR